LALAIDLVEMGWRLVITADGGQERPGIHPIMLTKMRGNTILHIHDRTGDDVRGDILTFIGMLIPAKSEGVVRVQRPPFHHHGEEVEGAVLALHEARR
jgi:hypothetical protein